MASRVVISGRFVDLYVRFADSSGNPVSTDETPTVKITDSVGTVRRAASNTGVSLVKSTTDGLYVLSYEVPDGGEDGYWIDTWSAEIGGVAVSSALTFLVTTDGTVATDIEPIFGTGDDVPWDFTKDEAHGVNILLKIMRYRLKSSGTRKVRSGNEYTDVACNIFTDTEMTAFLINSLSSFNQYPHFTRYSFADQLIQTTFVDIIIQGGVLLALAAQALIERGREFQITDNGVTYQPPAISEMLNSQYTAQLADYKEKLKMIKISIKPGPLGIGSFRVTAIAPAFLRLRHLRSRQII